MDYNRSWSDLNEHLREAEQASGGLATALAELEAHQRETGFIKDDLGGVRRHQFTHPKKTTATFRVQYNPKRAKRFNGSGVQTPPPDTENLNGGCFLCRENIRWQQQNAQVGFEIGMTHDIYHAWMNPFPLMPNHVVIAAENHVSQEWDMDGREVGGVPLAQLLGDLCETAERLPNHVGFYNGVDAGASIPDHLHFQFFRRPPKDPVFPLEQRSFRPPETDSDPLIVDDYPIAVALWRGSVPNVVSAATTWLRKWTDGNADRLAGLSSNFIAAGHEMGGVSLYFVPRERAKPRWNGNGGMVGGLELLGEFVFSSADEKAMLERHQVDYFTIEKALASVHTPIFPT